RATPSFDAGVMNRLLTRREAAGKRQWRPGRAGEPGFEPGTWAPKTRVIPFHHSPKRSRDELATSLDGRASPSVMIASAPPAFRRAPRPPPCPPPPRRFGTIVPFLLTRPPPTLPARWFRDGSGGDPRAPGATREIRSEAATAAATDEGIPRPRPRPRRRGEA